MPFSQPTLDQLISRARADIESEMQNGAVYLRRSLESASAKVHAGMAHSQHGHIAWVARQIIPTTADDELLIEWAEIFMGPNARRPAEAAEFDITVTGVDTTVIPADTVWSRGDGVLFTNTDPGVIASGEDTITVHAVVEGEDGNTIPGATLTLTNAIVGIDSAAIVQGAGSSAIGGGADIEDIETLRARLIAYMQNPPKGGAAGDYVTWAKEVSGVTRAWELPLQLGPSTVVVLFVQDLFDADGFFVSTTFPSGPDITEVREHIDELKPVTVNGYEPAASTYVMAPIENAVDMEINISPNNATVQLEIERQLQDLFLRAASPGGTIPLSQIHEAISIAAGETDHELVSPVANLVADDIELFTLGNLTFGDIP